MTLRILFYILIAFCGGFSSAIFLFCFLNNVEDNLTEELENKLQLAEEENKKLSDKLALLKRIVRHIDEKIKRYEGEKNND